MQEPDGTLAAPVSYATAATFSHLPETVAIGDLTGDNRNDVVVGHSGLGVELFPQLANRTLGAPTLTPTVNSNKIRIGQLSDDTRLDVAGVGWGTDTVSVLLQDRRGGLLAPVDFPVQHDGYDDLEIANVSGDKRAEIIVMSGQGLVPDVTVLRRTGNGRFGQGTEYPLGHSANAIGVGDANGDGRTDVVVASGGNRPRSTVSVLAQTSKKKLAAPVPYASYDRPGPVEVADVTRDGRADVVVAHNSWSRVGVYEQRADGTLGAERLLVVPYGNYDPHGLAVGDINSDGVPDIAIADSNNGLVVLRNFRVEE